MATRTQRPRAYGNGDPWADVELTEEDRAKVAAALDRPHRWGTYSQLIFNAQGLSEAQYRAVVDAPRFTWRECSRCGRQDCELADVDAPTASAQLALLADLHGEAS